MVVSLPPAVQRLFRDPVGPRDARDAGARIDLLEDLDDLVLAVTSSSAHSRHLGCRSSRQSGETEKSNSKLVSFWGTGQDQVLA